MEMDDLKCTTSKDYEAQLLECIEQNDAVKLTKIIGITEIDLNKVFGHPHYKTALQIVCSRNTDVDDSEILKILLANGADPLLQNQIFENKQCIHFAAERGNIDILKIIIDEYLKHNALQQSDILINFILYIKSSDKFTTLESYKKVDEKYLEVFEYLLQHDIDINVPESNGWTPIYAAAKYGFREIVEKILTVEQNVDLDDFKDYKNKSARELISENNLYSGELPPKLTVATKVTCETLKNCIRNRNINDFKINFISHKDQLNDDEKTSLLCEAVENNVSDIVRTIIDNLENVSANIPGYNKSALESACLYGYHKIVEIVLEKQKNSECISKGLIEVSKQIHSDRGEQDVDYERCTKLLLAQNTININSQDWNKNTALHYAIKYQNPEMVMSLLRKGASLACRNMSGNMAISDISADILKRHLDECIFEGNEKRNDRESKYIVVNFTTLLSPRDDAMLGNNNANCTVNMNQAPLLDDDGQEQINSQIDEDSDTPFISLLTEMDILKHMSTSPELKPLLTHPVIMTFLYLKWFRIRKFFYINLAVYLTFFISLLTYVFFCYNQALELRSKTHQFIVDLSHVMVSVMVVVLLIRELAQVFIFKWRYLKIFENWLEIILLSVTLAIVINQNDEVIIKQMSSVAILLSAIDLLLLVGQIPSLSTNIMMLRTVSLTFFKLLLWYSILIIAFALSFYTLFKNKEIPNGDVSETSTVNTQDENAEETNFFIDPGLSMFKTIVMLTGEFDASDINFDTYPIISHLIFLSFVFLIAIVLFNLLNGMAVSDIQMIKSDAELYSQIIRVEHIAQVERILLSKRFCRFIKYVRDLCLFPSNIKKTEVKLYPYFNWEIKFSENNDTAVKCYRCSQILLDKKIQRKINALLEELKENKLKMIKENNITLRLAELEKQQKEIIKLLHRNYSSHEAL